MAEDQPVQPLHRVAELAAQINALTAARDEAALQARAEGATWSAIGDALGVARQVAQARYRTHTPGWADLHLAELAALGGVASTYQHGPSATAVVVIRLPGPLSGSTLTFHPESECWTGSSEADGPLSQDRIDELLSRLPAEVHAEISEAGRKALSSARARKAGIAKRHQTVRRRGSPVGRPRR